MRDEQPQRPTNNDDRDAWAAYWKAQGMPWRTEPEIDEQRQRFLAERRAVKPDIEEGIYPYRDEHGSIKLTRADVEWLLATHDGGRGPVRWEEEKDKDEADRRWGLDVRGADVRAEDLRDLPLARLRAGLLALARAGAKDEWYAATPKQREAAGAHLGRVNLAYTHAEGAIFSNAHLEDAELQSSHLESARLHSAHLAGANLSGVYFDMTSNLNGANLSDKQHGSVFLIDVRWNGVNLALVDWAPVRILGTERRARQERTADGQAKDRATRVAQFTNAVRANRQLAVVLRTQGVNEEADRFAYRAQMLQRQVLRRQGRLGRAFGSWLLDLVSGYGYKPIRSVITYIAVILAFATVYSSVTNLGITPFLPTHATPLAWYEALVLSISSFHGRGLFPSALTLGDPIAVFAAAEAIIGLLVEITFIATFTQRFFAR